MPKLVSIDLATNPANNQTPKTGNSDEFLSSIIPGYKNLVGGASNIVQDLLNGAPSPSITRNANAAFGVASGQPATSGAGSFIGNRSYDLYNTQGAQRQQQGIGNLLNMISGISSPALSNQGQQLQNQQFGQNLAQNQNQFTASLNQNQGQFDTNMQLQNFLAQLQALGLGNSIVSSGARQNL